MGGYDICKGKAEITCGQSPMTEVLIINNATQGVKTPTKASLITVSSCYLTVRQQFDPALVDKRLHLPNALLFQAYPEAMKEHLLAIGQETEVSFDIRVFGSLRLARIQ